MIIDKKGGCGMVDLHTHTNCSDGTDDYKAVLKKADAAGVTYLSMTDHDNCCVYDQIKNDDITKYYKGVFIKGIELQAFVLGVSIELLGYGIDTDYMTKAINEIYLPFKEKGILYMTRLYDNCIQMGMRFDENVLEGYEKSGIYYPTLYLHNEMKKHIENRRFVQDDESWETESIFFRKYTSNPDSSLYVDAGDLVPSAERVAKLIKKAGGLVFIPHIFQYEDKSENILRYLMEHCEIDGIECYYSTFSKEQTDYLLNYCNKHNKYISAGSDYHGDNRANTKIGYGINNNLCVSEDILNDWKDKVL